MSAPLHQKTRFRWALLLVFPVLAALAMLFFANRARQENDWIRHTLIVQLSLERLLFNLDSAETNQRGYLLTKEDRFLAPYTAAVARVRQEFQSLRAFMSDNPRQQSALAHIEPLLTSKLDHMDENLRLRRAEDYDEARIDRGTALMDSIQNLASEMRTEENRLLTQRQLEFGEAVNRFTWTVSLVYLVLVAMVVSLYRAVGRFSRQATEAEHNLSRLNSELEQRVIQRTSSLQANQELLKTFVKHVPAAVAMLDRDMRYLQVSDRWCSDYSLNSDRILGRSHYEIFPDIPEPWKTLHRRCLAGESLRANEECWERADGSRTWLRWEIRPWGANGPQPEGILIFAEDISVYKHMEEALRTSEQGLRELAGSLLNAQEDERRRIARDLHDDVTQRLAFLSIEIGKLAALPADHSTARLRSFQEQVVQISQEVRRLSHGLHPSAIEDFGLSAALEEFCEDFNKAHTIHVRFESFIDDGALSLATASCLYRIAQESVQNAAKHAGSSDVRVTIRKADNHIELRVTDNGRGFCSDPGRLPAGLGIVSMKERVRLVGGALAIDSRPGQGTEVLATVPLPGAHYETAASAR